MRLMDRDIQILLKVNECMWLATSQIKRYFFQNHTMRAVNKRLRLFVDNGYLFFHQQSKMEECYFRLGSQGKSLLLDNTNLLHKDIYIPRKFPVQIQHFAKLNDLRWYYEQSALKIQAKTNFFFIDRELKGLLGKSLIIPDILLSFTIRENGFDKQYILALEYDNAQETPQYYGRDKVKKYVQMFDMRHPIFSHENLIIITFAYTRSRVVQLIRHSIKYLDNRLKFLFCSMDDLEHQNDFFAEIYIDPLINVHHSDKLLCPIIE